MKIKGKRIMVQRWIHAEPCVVRVEVEAVIPDADPSEPCLESETVRWLDDIQRQASAGQMEELAKVGQVYVRQSA
jgi:hypothetical protein